MERILFNKKIHNEARDACAIIAFIDKRGQSTHANIVQTIEALRKMGHRSGDINGEGDGCGISTDLPRDLWARRLFEKSFSPHLAESSSFFAAHLLLPAPIKSQKQKIMQKVRAIFQSFGCEILLELTDGSRDIELGPRARAVAPLFWQIAGMAPDKNRVASQKKLFNVQLAIEQQFPELHIASISLDTVVYKVQGVPEMLPRVFPELRDEDMCSVMTIGHGRYSTNTLPTVERSQPFSLLAHNGEINTIDRLRSTGRTHQIEPVAGGSDSQDLNRIIEGLINLYDLDIIEAMEMVFPVIDSEVDNYRRELKEVYSFYRWFFSCSAQGPAAVLARQGDTCVGSVDALGLRPLWCGESDYYYFLSSEKGVVDLKRNMNDPRPLAPGEKIAISCRRGKLAEVLHYSDIQDQLVRLLNSRRLVKKHLSSLYVREDSIPENEEEQAKLPQDHFLGGSKNVGKFNTPHFLAAFGWRQYDISIRQRVAHDGREVIGSMGYTGPLPSFVHDSLPNLSDFCKENVAVVTNPAIDRERENEHFSTQVILGRRPNILADKGVQPLGLALKSPLLLGCQSLSGILTADQLRKICEQFSTYLIEDVTNFFTGHQRDPKQVKLLDATYKPVDGLAASLESLAGKALDAVGQGAILLILDDSESFSNDRVFIDPALAVATLHESLTNAGVRRDVSIVVQSAAIRNLHDIMFLLGLGADALHPYLLWRISAGFAGEKDDHAPPIMNTFSVLQKGIEKVISTMGIHELCGYGRIFSAIGFSADLRALMGIPNFCESDSGGLSLRSLEEMARRRYQRAAAGGDEGAAIYKEPLRNPKVGRILRKTAVGEMGYLEMAKGLAKIDEELPTSIRHIVKTKKAPEKDQVAMGKVDISVGNHALPLVVAAMSFGSQGEISFRSYAEAAQKVNIICMNGEGGEIPDMLGKYRHNRGQQIASGRFGVFMSFLNSADILEIKIGQGAKPGEGGHLPGNKVTEMVSQARRCKAGITLISPSNHHDIYSIEDLAQVITELKTANPHARVSVKIPVASGVGTIAVGIAKAGADIINISGFEGGTGAAREHAKKFVGLPAEIGVSEAHRALTESGLRQNVEIWGDGGMRSGNDVLKMILLGANRVGLGTAVLMGIGCISCQRCHLDQCPRGISTQLQTKEDAEAVAVKGFKPRILETEVENLARLLNAMGDELRMRVAELGETSLQNLVGRSDLLQQYKMHSQLDAVGILQSSAAPHGEEKYPKPPIVRKPLNYLTRLISDLSMERFGQGDTRVQYAEDGVRSTDRAVGTYLAGAIVRKFGDSHSSKKAVLRLSSSVPGNGLCAFTSRNLDVVVEGGCQDGAAKGSDGGLLGVFKGQNVFGKYVDGSTGKSFAYGATDGLLMIQNMADSRACIRLSGADVVFGGRITSPICDELGNIASRAHLKGFAFEYMTGGRALVLGDPGPWICAGMTGGVIYQCLYPEFGFDKQAIERRLAKSANVKIQSLTGSGLADVSELLERYINELKKGLQNDEAHAVSIILHDPKKRFLAIVPKPLRPPSAE
ncbi:MAG: glutamate synthase-related protein [Thermodesulfobacteriota bacterium]